MWSMAYNEDYLATDPEKEAMNLIDSERINWNEEEVFVTRNKSYNMRNVINRCRNSYYGIFKTEKDESTGYEKIPVPLTEWTTETLVKNIDLDTKDISIKAKHPDNFGVSSALRFIVSQKLQEINFGEFINDSIRNLSIDGTIVTKSWKSYNELQEKVGLRRENVDLMNLFLDPAARSVQDTPIIEKSIYTIDDFKKHDWMNTDKVEGHKNLGKNENTELASNYIQKSEVPLVDVWERWGKMPKYLITGNEKDRNDWVDGHIIVSGLEDESVIHKIEEVGKIKPYEECWLKRTPNRWFGRGVAEQLFFIQTYLNELANIRINNMRLLQQGLFQIRQGSGITQGMIARLKTGGAIRVNQLDTDIKQFNIQDLNTQASLLQEDRLLGWAEKLTSTFDIARGETLPSTQTATAANLQASSTISAFNLIKENIGLYLKRLLERHWIPTFLSDLKREDVIRITGDYKNLAKLDETLIDHLVNEEAIRFRDKNGFWPNEDEILREKDKIKKDYKKFDKDRFLKIKDDLFNFKYDVEVYVTNENFDKNALINNLTALLSSYNQLTGKIDTDAVVQEVLDLLG